MGGAKPKPSGDAPTRWSSRPRKQRIDQGTMRRYLFQGPRARIDRSNTTGVHGNQAAVDAAVDADSEEVCAAGWLNGHKERSEARIISAVRTLRSRPASAGGATAAEMQNIQDLSVVVVGLLNNDKVLKQVIKAMNGRNNTLMLDLHTRLQALSESHKKLEAEVHATK